MSVPPRPDVAFRPRADAATLSRISRAAHEALDRELCDPAIAEIVARHLESLAPAEDLDVLERYGFAEMRESAAVRFYDGQSWSFSCSIPLPRPVRVPRNGNHLCAGGPRHWEDPHLGCKPETWAAMSPEERAQLASYDDETRRQRLPAETDAFFTRLADARHAYRRETRELHNFPADFKARTGRYPTWAEIADALPITGPWLRRLWG